MRLSRYVAVVLLFFGCGVFAAPASATPNLGYKDHQYGKLTGSITASKPESKLWFSDGVWWADMLYPGSGIAEHHIARLDRDSETWSDTGTKLDVRPTSRSDVLLDDATGKVYVASHMYADVGKSSGNEGRLYRYSYDAGTKTYVKDWGSPAKIFNGADTETLVIARDSTGTLWATWMLDGQVFVNHTLRPDPLSAPDDKDWGTPYVLPFPVADEDDISSIVAFAGRVGVMWTNKKDGQFFFATHTDGTGDTAPDWAGGPIPGLPSRDDHINLKADAFGRVYAAVKYTTVQAAEARIALLVRDPVTGVWEQHVVAQVRDTHTRPIVLLDEAAQVIHIYMTGPEPPNVDGTDGGTIYEKTSPMAPISFAPGLGTPVVRDADNPALNDVTSTKQPIDATSGVVLLTNNPDTNTYWHGDVRLDGSSAPPPPPLAARSLSGFPAVADARVDVFRPTLNYGSSTALTVKDGAARSYLRFTLTGITGSVTGVTLRLKAASTNAEGGTVYATSNDWNESTVTWSASPAPIGPALASIGHVNPGTREIALSPSAVTGNGTYSFVISDGESGSAVYYSRESDDAPQLVVTTGPSLGTPSSDPPAVQPPAVTPRPSGPTLTAAIARRRAALALSRHYRKHWRGGHGRLVRCVRVARNTYSCRATWRKRAKRLEARARVSMQGHAVRVSRMTLRVRR